MPLPLPNLDDRRWAGLVEEGRGLIPRHAPAWTDHNLHDPGITLIDLFAWLAEMACYRLNRVPERHRRKFLALIGFTPRDPVPSYGMLQFTPASGSAGFVLPAGTEFEGTAPDQRRMPFRTLRDMTVSPVELRALLVDAGDGTLWDRSRDLADGLPIYPFGSDPQSEAALYLGFDEIPVGTPVALGFRFLGPGNDLAERLRLIEESIAHQLLCRPVQPRFTCGKTTPEPPDALPAHHSARVVWEVFAGGGWTELTPQDDSRSMTLDGIVEITLPASAERTALASVAAPLFYVRARLDAAGQWDAAPVLLDVAPNTALIEQTVPVTETFVIDAAATPTGTAPVPGTLTRLTLGVDERKIIQTLASGVATGPELRVWSYRAPSGGMAGELTVEAEMAGRGTGRPDQTFVLRNAPVDSRTLRLYTLAGGMWQEWTRRADFDSSTRIDFHYTIDSTSGALMFGSGERGRVPEAGTLIFAVYRSTNAHQGNLGPGTITSLRRSPVNAVLLNALPGAALDQLNQITTNRAGTSGGLAAETLNRTAGRAVETLHAHQRILDLAAEARSTTLDQAGRVAVRALQPPSRGVNLLDLERIALSVPGTRIARARAWAATHPDYPCLTAPGVVTVIVVPELPVEAPMPSKGLLEAVRAYLEPRRMLCTVLKVTGPEYLTVNVSAQVRIRANASAERVRVRILEALDGFLHPLQGGPGRLGWPFGRNVYRSEILQLMDEVAGMDHVVSLSITAGENQGSCGDINICALTLVRSGQHTIEIL
ncbi:MAG: baseplate J/gp47 family protein [Bryobacteraceae bacterium]|nr:baseplate J/gp47 family protein [Bryobacterales bacterium]NUN00610.1 baseplate J/gp47 family protein [Bryobacteraceae bacterium]